MKKVFISSILFILVIFLAACGGNSKEKETLEVALWSDGVEDALNASIESFNEKHPDVEVKVTITPFAEYWTKLKTSLGGGSGPDVFWMNGPNFHQYSTTNLIKNLEPLIEEDSDFNKDTYYETVTDMYTYDGDLYAAPYFFDSVAMFYNKALFDEAGVDYPDETWTWDDIEKYGEKLTNEDEGIYGYAGYTVISQEGYYNLIHQAGGYIINDEKTKSGLDLPETKEAFHFLQNLIDKGISPTTKQQIETVPNQMFMSNKMAMLNAVSTNAAMLHEALGDDLGVAPLPKGKEAASIIHGVSWAMNNKSKNEDLAWELIKSLTNEDGNKAIAESGYTMPADKEMSKIWLDSIPSLDLQVFIDAQDYGAIYPISKNTAEWQSIETKEIQDALLQGKSIDDALDSAAEQMNEILDKENSE